MVKTHLPLFLQEEALKMNKAIVCYRNPEEAIMSLFQLQLTKSHYHKLPLDFFQENAGLWEAFVSDMTKHYFKWYEFWLQQAKE